MRALLPLLLLLAACADTTAPMWPPAGVLEAEPGTDRIRVTWPAPVDDDVLVYVVTVDGQERTRTPSSTHTVSVSGLEDQMAYLFEVRAIDGDENESVPLSLRAETLDGTPPEWPEGAALTATSPSPKEAEARQVDLSWPSAIDATRYRVSRDGADIASLEALSHHTDGAPLIATTTFEVVAFDEAGNESEALAIVWELTPQAQREAEEGDEPERVRIGGIISALSAIEGNEGTITNLFGAGDSSAFEGLTGLGLGAPEAGEGTTTENHVGDGPNFPD